MGQDHRGPVSGDPRRHQGQALVERAFQLHEEEPPAGRLRAGRMRTSEPTGRVQGTTNQSSG
jgi:hypothetical protein